MIKPIQLFYEPILRQKALPVDTDDRSFGYMVDDLDATLESTKTGVGASGQQIGYLSKIFLVNHSGFKEFFINPEIISVSKETCEFEEGCLSIGGIYAPVLRPSQVTIKYLNRNLNEVKKTYDNFVARIILHESDHLIGVLFIDYIQ